MKKLINELETLHKLAESKIGFALMEKWNQKRRVINIACRNYPFKEDLSNYTLSTFSNDEWFLIAKYIKNGIKFLKNLVEIEEKVIEDNYKRSNLDKVPLCSFDYRGVSIHDPYKDESSISEVDPFDYYNDDEENYFTWIEKLCLLQFFKNAGLETIELDSTVWYKVNIELCNFTDNSYMTQNTKSIKEKTYKRLVDDEDILFLLSPDKAFRLLHNPNEDKYYIRELSTHFKIITNLKKEGIEKFYKTAVEFQKSHRFKILAMKAKLQNQLYALHDISTELGSYYKNEIGFEFPTLLDEQYKYEGFSYDLAKAVDEIYTQQMDLLINKN